MKKQLWWIHLGKIYTKFSWLPIKKVNISKRDSRTMTKIFAALIISCIKFYQLLTHQKHIVKAKGFFFFFPTVCVDLRSMDMHRAALEQSFISCWQGSALPQVMELDFWETFFIFLFIFLKLNANLALSSNFVWTRYTYRDSESRRALLTAVSWMAVTAFSPLKSQKVFCHHFPTWPRKRHNHREPQLPQLRKKKKLWLFKHTKLQEV